MSNGRRTGTNTDRVRHDPVQSPTTGEEHADLVHSGNGTLEDTVSQPPNSHRSTLSSTDQRLPSVPASNGDQYDQSYPRQEEREPEVRSSIDTRASFQSTRPSTREMNKSCGQKPKVKLGPRPSLENHLPGSGDGLFRPKATLPAGLRMPTRKTFSNAPKSHLMQNTLRENRVQLTTTQPFPMISTTNHLDDSDSRSIMSVQSSHTRTPKITPEKRRLMKALQIRQKHMEASKMVNSTNIDEEGKNAEENVPVKPDLHEQVPGQGLDLAPKEPLHEVQDSPSSILDASDEPSTQASSINDEETSTDQSQHSVSSERPAAKTPQTEEDVSFDTEPRLTHGSTTAKDEETDVEDNRFSVLTAIQHDSSGKERVTSSLDQAGPDVPETRSGDGHDEDLHSRLAPIQNQSPEERESAKSEDLSSVGDSEKSSSVIQDPLKPEAPVYSPETQRNMSLFVSGSATEVADGSSPKPLLSEEGANRSNEDENPNELTVAANDMNSIETGDGSWLSLSTTSERSTIISTAPEAESLISQDWPLQEDLQASIASIDSNRDQVDLVNQSPTHLEKAQVVRTDCDRSDPAETQQLESPSSALEPIGVSQYPETHNHVETSFIAQPRSTVNKKLSIGDPREMNDVSAVRNEERQEKLQARRGGVVDPVPRASTPEQSEERFLSDESFMEELKSAKLQEAKPVSVSKSPLKPLFPRTESEFTREEMPRSSRSVSSPFEHPQKEEQRSSSPPRPPPLSLRSFSAVSPPRFDTSPIATSQISQAKKTGVSSGISQRIRALEKLSTRPTSPSSSNGSTPTFLNFPKTNFRSNSTTSEFNGSSGFRSRPSTAHPSPASSPEAMKQDPFNRSPKSTSESVSVTAMIVRDTRVSREGTGDNYKPSELQLKQSPLVVERQSKEAPKQPDVTPPPLSPLKPPRPKYSRYSSTRSISSSSTEPKGDRRSSFASKRSMSSRNGSDLDLPSLGAEKSSNPNNLNGISEEKRESRGSRIMKRMSSITSVSKRSITKAISPGPRTDSITENHELTSQDTPAPLLDLGDVNVQFPDSLVSCFSLIGWCPR